MFNSYKNWKLQSARRLLTVHDQNNWKSLFFVTFWRERKITVFKFCIPKVDKFGRACSSCEHVLVRYFISIAVLSLLCYCKRQISFIEKHRQKFQLFWFTFTFKNENTSGCLSLGVRWNRVTDDLRDFQPVQTSKPFAITHDFHELLPTLHFLNVVSWPKWKSRDRF